MNLNEIFAAVILPNPTRACGVCRGMAQQKAGWRYPLKSKTTPRIST